MLTDRSNYNLRFHLRIYIVLFSSQICDDEDTGAIGIENMGGIFIVIFIGIALALIALGVEYYYYKFRAVKHSDEAGDSEPKKVAEYDKKESKW